MIHFNQKVWQQKFISNKFNTAWKCSRCGIGGLQLTAEISTKLEYSTVALSCTDAHCRTKYHAVGKIKFMAGKNEVGPEYYKPSDYRFYPNHFEPEVIMFELPVSMNEEGKLLLARSFNHFWYDLDACANKIRQTLELIVAENQGVGKHLDAKIESLRLKLGDGLTDALLALKWIGNEGSHLGRPFERDEILAIYEILVIVLNQLYPDESERERRESFVRLINEQKGLKKR